MGLNTRFKIMRHTRRIGVVEEEDSDETFRRVVRELQWFAFKNGIRPLALDWYLLSFGGQLEARQDLAQRYCSGPGPCSSHVCPVGCAGLCMDYSGSEWTGSLLFTNPVVRHQ